MCRLGKLFQLTMDSTEGLKILCQSSQCNAAMNVRALWFSSLQKCGMKSGQRTVDRIHIQRVVGAECKFIGILKILFTECYAEGRLVLLIIQIDQRKAVGAADNRPKRIYLTQAVFQKAARCQRVEYRLNIGRLQLVQYRIKLHWPHCQIDAAIHTFGPALNSFRVKLKKLTNMTINIVSKQTVLTNNVLILE